MNDGDSPRGRRSTFVESDSRLARYLARPVQQFLHVEAAGGIVLLVATVVALLWANSPWSAGYRLAVRHRDGPRGRLVRPARRPDALDQRRADGPLLPGGRARDQAGVGDRRAPRPTGRGAADDRRPRRHGGARGPVPPRHRPRRRRARAGASRWRRTSPSRSAWWPCSAGGSRTPLKVFLLTLAVVDDIGAIVVIAVAYTDELEPLVARRRGRARPRGRRPPSAPGSCTRPCTSSSALAMWLCAYEAGIHPTLPGWSWACWLPADARVPATYL